MPILVRRLTVAALAVALSLAAAPVPKSQFSDTRLKDSA